MANDTYLIPLWLRRPSPQGEKGSDARKKLCIKMPKKARWSKHQMIKEHFQKLGFNGFQTIKLWKPHLIGMLVRISLSILNFSSLLTVSGMERCIAMRHKSMIYHLWLLLSSHGIEMLKPHLFLWRAQLCEYTIFHSRSIFCTFLMSPVTCRSSKYFYISFTIYFSIQYMQSK